MILLLNSSCWSSMNLILMGRVYMLRFTSSDRPSMPCSLALSFSVVTIILGEGILAKVSFIRSMSLLVKQWWSGNVNGVMLSEIFERREEQLLVWIKVHRLDDNPVFHRFQVFGAFCNDDDVCACLSALRFS